MKKNIGIVTPGGNYFAKYDMAKAISANVYGLQDKTKDIKEDHLILVGYESLKWYSESKNKDFKTVAVIFCDTLFCVNYVWCNKYCYDNNITVYGMPDQDNFFTNKYIPIYQTIEIPKDINPKKKTSIISIGHSPQRRKRLGNMKGTNEIKKVFDTLSNTHNIELKVISGEDWRSCLYHTGRCEIFIDQLIYGNPNIDQSRWGGVEKFYGGVGQSGLEAMQLKCCTMVAMKPVKTEPYFPPPPVVLTSYKTFQKDLENLIINEDLRKSIIDEQYNWIKKYCSKEFFRDHLTRHINE